MKHRSPPRQYRLELWRKTLDDGAIQTAWALFYSCRIPMWSMISPLFYNKKDLFIYFSDVGMNQRQKRKLGQQMAELEGNPTQNRSRIYFELPPISRKEHNKIQKHRNKTHE